MTVQQTTFHSTNHENVKMWLDALYNKADASQALDLDNLYKTTASIKNLQRDIGYNFTSGNKLILSLTHTTFCYEFDVRSNERLEFLGDSLVNLIVAKVLLKKFPDASEGELSRLRGALVNEAALALLSKSISLGENLLLGKGEFKNQGHLKDSLLADAFEALCAAIYEDSGAQMDIVEKVFLKIVEQFEVQNGQDFFNMKKLESFDSKTQLQETVVALHHLFPTYKSREEKNGFIVEVWIGDKKIAEGQGPSKKKLEKELARQVLDEKKYQF